MLGPPFRINSWNGTSFETGTRPPWKVRVKTPTCNSGTWGTQLRLSGLARATRHFITFCCYQRRALLGTAQVRNLAMEILDDVRVRYRFALVGYVIMPEHVHLLIGESRAVSPAKVVQVFKQRLSRRMRGKENEEEPQPPPRCNEKEVELRRFWQRRYYDFSVYTRAKLKEKMEYIHANPVKEKLVEHPQDWPWSSWSFYETGEGLLKMDAT